ncbi:MAG: hypothetical protein E6767_20735, partial [Dysgonomonas sp.]|nr:hypothetical protein [Dysgonomonas sp.]
ITAPVVAVPVAPAGVSVTVTTPAAVDKITVTAPAITTPTAPTDKNIVISTLTVPGGYEPTMIVLPTAPTQPSVTLPTNFTPPALNFVGTGFYQSWGIGSVQNGAKRGGIDTSIVIENYEKYNTPDNTESNPFKILTGKDGSTINGGMAWSNGKIEASSSIEFSYNETLVAGSAAGARSAFINELRDHNATISGHYSMTYVGGDPTTVPSTSYTKMFISHNPAGRNTAEGYTALDGSGMTGWLGESGGAKTAKFDGTLELHGSSNTTPHGTLYEILVGIEHQLWDSQDNKVGYSIFENAGKITLASGNNVIGIMIDTEALNNNGRDKQNNNKTINSGEIIINNQNSIGIDFGAYQAYQYIPLDVEIGNITINGNNNYGYRMKNIFTSNNVYFDDVTVSGGSGKIVVSGQKNVGLAIGKSLSSTPAPHTEIGNLNHGVLTGANPISNFFGINVEIIGTQVVGFLRLADYSTNNTNDFIFNSQVMGTFNIGTGATESTLIRTDKYGIQIAADITTSGVSGSKNTVAHSNGETQNIYNSANITTGSGLIQTTGMAATGTIASTKINIKNSGTIIIGGKESTGMYVDQYTQGENTVTGTIKMTGNEKNTAISNEGKFNLAGTIEINGEKSSGLYNKGTGVTNINDTTVIKAKNGATAIYGNGGTITLAAGKSLTINVDDSSTPLVKGLAVYASNSSNIILKGADIKVIGAAAGIASFGSGSNIDLAGGILNYTGEGYAVYSDGTGTIDLTNTNLYLGGTATGLELDLSIAPALRPIILNNTTVNMMSNNAIGASLKNATGLMSSNLQGTIIGALGGNIVFVPGTDLYGTYDKYKVAAVDGGDLTIDADMDKFSNVNTSDGYFYSRRFLAQRLKLNVANNVTVNAATNTIYATDYFKNQVVGLEMNSSKAATSATDAQINLLAGSKVVADRTDAGAGAIGLYMNFGKIDIAAGAEVEVEKVTGGGNIVNDKAVGV